MKKRFLALLLALLLTLVSLTALAKPLLNDDEILVDTDEWTATDGYSYVEYGEAFSDPYDVALYLHCFEELPPNFITKKDAQSLGWVSREGNLWDVAYGMSIGGDRFYTREDQIPEIVKQKCWECDVNYEGGYRADERLVFSNDGRVYYTNNHYKTFTQLYDGWYYDGGYYRGIGGQNG